MKTDTRPNVLLICVDQWPGRLMHCAGHPTMQTPTIDQLARNGILFPNAVSMAPTCIPARRNLMTGTPPRTHGDRVFSAQMEMPNLPTLAGTFAEHGYQTGAVGKLHVYPQRDRIGFQDALINEEGRHFLNVTCDDYEQYLFEQGYGGQAYATGVCNNDYLLHPWHLPEEAHSTNWTAREMQKLILRRDPRKPAFWFMSFSAPHPPIFPPQAYLDLYRDEDIDLPVTGDWSRAPQDMPYFYQMKANGYAANLATPREIINARRGFYAGITHIDHQIRTVIALLQQRRLLDNTVIALVSDHGDMLGDHHLWAKSVMLQMSTQIPFIIIPTAEYRRMGWNRTDQRLVELMDVMPTLLDLCGLPIPDSCEGISLATDQARATLYAEHGEGDQADRMVRDTRYKLIYSPVGNRSLLFDLERDPAEQHNLAELPQYAEHRERLTQILIANLYGGDEAWVVNGRLEGLPAKTFAVQPNRALSGQRSLHFL